MTKSRNKVLTLYYHRINVLEHDYNQLCVTPIRFRQQMLYLKNHYYITRFDEDWSLKEDAVTITFDDGYLDNLQYALPILEELHIPATIFVSVDSLEVPKEMWWDELEKLILIGEKFPKSFSLKDEEFGCEWETSSREKRENCYQAIHFLMKNFASLEKREEWMQQLRLWRKCRMEVRPEYRMLSSKDCLELAKSKWISIGAHTVTHPSLAKLDRAVQEEEIAVSIEVLSKLLQKEILVFSYPFGVKGSDYNCTTIDICQRNGIIKAASTECALWNDTTNNFEIPRKVVRNWNLFEFEEKIKEYWEDYL